MTEGGLRERKKTATRRSLHLAALELASRDGVGAVTVEDVAAAAGVSPRTFFNYFSTKEEAFVCDDLDRGRAFVQAVVGAPEGAPLWPLLRDAAMAAFASDDLPGREQALKQALVRHDPDVAAHMVATFVRLEGELVVELTRRATPGSSSLQPRLMASAVVAVLRAAAETWLSDAGAGADFPLLLAEAFDALAPSFRTA